MAEKGIGPFAGPTEKRGSGVGGAVHTLGKRRVFKADPIDGEKQQN